MTSESELLRDLLKAIMRSPLGMDAIAELSGVHLNTLYYWQIGRTRSPRIDTMEKVARAIGMRFELTADYRRIKLVPERPRLPAARLWAVQ